MVSNADVNSLKLKRGIQFNLFCMYQSVTWYCLLRASFGSKGPNLCCFYAVWQVA